MKQAIHPEYKTIQVLCSCGEKFETRSTGADLSLEVCSKCHPFYTGEHRLVDTGGRIEDFRKRYASNKKASTVSDKSE